MTITSWQSIDSASVQRILGTHLPMYRRIAPTYQLLMLRSLRKLWLGRHRVLLDVGGGTGVIAEAISKLFPVDEVQVVDIVDRFCRTLSVRTLKYDGRTLPFRNGHFDAATLNNVIHHVAPDARGDFFHEIRRVVEGPVYIKDHETCGAFDDFRLTILDVIGNIPTAGMMSAHYLSRAEWERLAAESGYRIAARAEPMQYRRGTFAKLFPNRLEVTMRFEPT